MYGPSHREVATALSNLGEYQRAQRQLHASRGFAETRTGHGSESYWVYDHQDVAIDLNNLALLYDNLGRYPDAEQLYQQALTIDEKTLGTDHLGVATDLNNLAEAYRAARQTRRGRTALPARADDLGEIPRPEWRPPPLRHSSNLGALAAAHGKNTEAEILLTRALDIWRKTVRPDHPSLAATLRALGSVQSALHDYPKAGSLLHAGTRHRRERPRRKTTLQLAKDLSNLGLVLYLEQKYAAAESSLKRALDLDETNYGKEHLTVASSLNNLAEVYRVEGKYAQAEPLYRRAIADR